MESSQSSPSDRIDDTSRISRAASLLPASGGGCQRNCKGPSRIGRTAGSGGEPSENYAKLPCPFHRDVATGLSRPHGIEASTCSTSCIDRLRPHALQLLGNDLKISRTGPAKVIAARAGLSMPPTVDPNMMQNVKALRTFQLQQLLSSMRSAESLPTCSQLPLTIRSGQSSGRIGRRRMSSPYGAAKIGAARGRYHGRHESSPAPGVLFLGNDMRFDLRIRPAENGVNMSWSVDAPAGNRNRRMQRRCRP